MECYEIYIVKKNTFTEYTPNILKDGAIVKVNDIELNETNGDFSIENYKIIFNNPLTIGDKVIIANSILDNTKVATKSSYDTNALIRLFSSATKLKLNHEYTLSLATEHGVFENKFTALYSPFYSNIKTVRTDTGSLLDATSDESIAFLMYKNSKSATELLGGDIEVVPSYVKNYVRYMTDLDLCQSFYTSTSGSYGKRSKSIGDMSIDIEVKLPCIKDMMLRFKELLKPLEDLMNGDKVTAESYVKDGSTAYTV